MVRAARYNSKPKRNARKKKHRVPVSHDHSYKGSKLVAEPAEEILNTSQHKLAKNTSSKRAQRQSMIQDSFTALQDSRRLSQVSRGKKNRDLFQTNVGGGVFLGGG